MRALLASGSDHRLGQNDKPPLTLEGGNQYYFLRGVIILIKTARFLESASRAKQTGSARKNIQPAAQPLHHRQTQPPPPRQPPFELRKTTATNRASLNAAQSRLDSRRVYQGIGIHKEKNVAVGLSGAGIASGRICRCSTRITCAPCCRAIEAVVSQEPSSTTMISYGSATDSNALRMAEIHRPIQTSSLCAGTINEIICLAFELCRHLVVVPASEARGPSSPARTAR